MKITYSDFDNESNLSHFCSTMNRNSIISIETLIFESDKTWSEEQERWLTGRHVLRVWYYEKN